MAKILIATSSFNRRDPVFLKYAVRENEFIFNPYGRKLKKEELLSLAADVRGIIAGTEEISRDVLKKLPHLRVISRCGVGMDNVDLKACDDLGIRVYNTPSAPTIAVAELTVGLMLDLLRMISRSDRGIREEKWHKFMGSLLTGKKIGIIGFGRIGKDVARLLFPFKCGIYYYDPLVRRIKTEAKRLPFNRLLKEADIVTIHADVRKSIIGGKELDLMKKSACIINTSRGKAIDEKALFRALKKGRLAGAALDVYSIEPYCGALRGLDNTVLTAHIGSYAQESRADMERESLNNLFKGLKGR